MEKEHDFSDYRIYLPVEEGAGMLIAPNDTDTSPLQPNQIFSFNEGIEKMLKENRKGLYLIPEEYEESLTEYFQEKYGILAL